jgi:hypothetical protein
MTADKPKSHQLHALRCLFDELLAAYTDAQFRLETASELLQEAVKDRDGYARDCKVLRAALHDDMWSET